MLAEGLWRPVPRPGSNMRHPSPPGAYANLEGQILCSLGLGVFIWPGAFIDSTFLYHSTISYHPFKLAFCFLNIPNVVGWIMFPCKISTSSFVESVNGTLYGKRGLCCWNYIKYLEMKNCSGLSGYTLNAITSVLIRVGGFNTQTEDKRERPQIKEWLQPLEAEETRNQLPPRASGRGAVLE